MQAWASQGVRGRKKRANSRQLWRHREPLSEPEVRVGLQLILRKVGRSGKPHPDFRNTIGGGSHATGKKAFSVFFYFCISSFCIISYVYPSFCLSCVNNYFLSVYHLFVFTHLLYNFIWPFYHLPFLSFFLSLSICCLFGLVFFLFYLSDCCANPYFIPTYIQLQVQSWTQKNKHHPVSIKPLKCIRLLF